MRSQTQIRLSNFMAGALVLSLVGCAGTELFEEHRVKRQDEAGSVHFAVISVAPWGEYAESMRPGFVITPEEALSKVIPTTRTLQESVIDSVQAAAAVSIDNTGGEGKSGGGEGEEKKDGRTRADAPVIAQTQINANRLAGLSGPLEGDVGMDPMLQYQAATALYQEVQLLNRYIQDVSIDKGYEAFVVRLQVSLVPTARNEPYDAYVTLSFFAGDGNGDGSEAKTRDLPIGDLMGETVGDTTPKVVPLLVTDNLEGTMHSRSVENIRQFAGALSFMSSFVGAAGSVQSTKDELSSVFGRDLNSLLNVSRVSDNTIRVRLGAMQAATASYSMVPRNHSITVLVMVPRSVQQVVEVISSTTLIDAETGIALPERPDIWLEGKLGEVAKKYKLGAPAGKLMPLMSIVQANDEVLFRDRLTGILGEGHAGLSFVRPLWVEMAQLLVGSRYARAKFDLPEAGETTEEDAMFREQVGILSDDGGARSVVALRGGNISRPDKLQATLVVRTATKELQFLPETVVMRGPQAAAQFVFPSLKSLGLEAAAAAAGALTLRIDYETWSEDYDLLYRPGWQ